VIHCTPQAVCHCARYTTYSVCHTISVYHERRMRGPKYWSSNQSVAQWKRIIIQKSNVTELNYIRSTSSKKFIAFLGCQATICCSPADRNMAQPQSSSQGAPGERKLMAWLHVNVANLTVSPCGPACMTHACASPSICLSMTLVKLDVILWGK
jgi:hypothetical protein